MIPQDDPSVLPTSSQQHPIPHLTECEHAAIMSFDLSAYLIYSYMHKKKIIKNTTPFSTWGLQGAVPFGRRAK